MCDLDLWEGERGVAGEDDVASVWEMTVGESLIGMSAHDDCFSLSESFEMSEDIGNIDQLVALKSDGEVAIDGGYEGYIGWHKRGVGLKRTTAAFEIGGLRWCDELIDR